jgi:hypothetical protein
MIIAFWFYVIMTVAWFLGVISFAYHAVSFRYPKDIALVMLTAFFVLAVPTSLMLIGYLADIYGGNF